MKQTIPNSNSIILTGREWLITIAVFLAFSATIYNGWYHWEKLAIEPDYRSTCWEERMSDYWAYMQWCRYARSHYKILIIGDSVIWGQEVSNNETISHYLNAQLGKEEIANLGIDGLTDAALDGLVTYYGNFLHDTNVILQFNPLWMGSPSRDMREKWRFHHPRLVPQLNRRLKYYKNLNERVGYLFEHHLRLPPFIRHQMVNYFDNKSIAAWLMDNPYRCPLSAITFKSAPMMKEKQGLGKSWLDRRGGGRLANEPFLSLNESIQWKCYLDALAKLKKMHVNVFILLGPFNTYALTPASRERSFVMLDAVKEELDRQGLPYFDTTHELIPSREYGDNCHALAGGHAILAEAMVKDPVFQKWMTAIK
jgi:hypothetical protein